MNELENSSEHLFSSVNLVLTRSILIFFYFISKCSQYVNRKIKKFHKLKLKKRSIEGKSPGAHIFQLFKTSHIRVFIFHYHLY